MINPQVFPSSHFIDEETDPERENDLAKVTA